MKLKELLNEAMSKDQAVATFARFGVRDALKYAAPQLKTLYLALAKKNHPDAGGSVERMTEINAAYDVLKKVKAGLEAFGFNRDDFPYTGTKHTDALNQFWAAAERARNNKK